MIETHIDGLFGDADTDFLRRATELLREKIAKGEAHPEAFVEEATDELIGHVDHAVGTALSELKSNLQFGTGDWDRHHKHLIEAFDCQFSRIDALINEAGDDGSSIPKLARLRLSRGIGRQRARMYRQQAGWNAPKPEPWHERFKWPLGIAGAIILYLAGLYTDEIKERIDEIIGVEHQSPGTQLPPPEVEPSPTAAETPAR